MADQAGVGALFSLVATGCQIFLQWPRAAADQSAPNDPLKAASGRSDVVAASSIWRALLAQQFIERNPVVRGDSLSTIVQAH
jgi:hypothetical protein